MIRVLGERGSGKTTKLIQLASENGYTIVAWNVMSARFIKDTAQQKGIKVRVINCYDFMREISEHGYGHKDKYLVDELDAFLDGLNVVGYSDSSTIPASETYFLPSPSNLKKENPQNATHS